LVVASRWLDYRFQVNVEGPNSVKTEELLLPESVRRKASVSDGGEHAWRQHDVEEVLQGKFLVVMEERLGARRTVRVSDLPVRA
jgi:hypothetical protein